MAKRRKKRNNSPANQPSEPDSINAVSDQLPSTAAATEGSSADGSLPIEAAASKGVNNSSGFFQGTKEELEKVVWPDRQQLISESIAVFLMVSLSAVIISFIDNLFRWASGLVFG